jgi:hypothetical protein
MGQAKKKNTKRYSEGKLGVQLEIRYIPQKWTTRPSWMIFYTVMPNFHEYYQLDTQN